VILRTRWSSVREVALAGASALAEVLDLDVMVILSGQVKVLE